MPPTVSQADLESRLNSVDTPAPLKAKLSINSLDTYVQGVERAIAKSGVPHKELGRHPARVSRQIKAVGKDQLNFYEMLRDWPAEVWTELVEFIVLVKCSEQFSVERTMTIKEIA
jgi:hypothetical protein